MRPEDDVPPAIEGVSDDDDDSELLDLSESLGSESDISDLVDDDSEDSDYEPISDDDEDEAIDALEQENERLRIELASLRRLVRQAAGDASVPPRKKR